MRILVVGGTRFVGRHLVEAALAAGHEVTVLHRGRTGAELFPGVEHLLADRDDPALAGILGGRSFDATADMCAYLPGQVASLADALGDRGGHHLLISSVSAYAPPDGPGIDESAPLYEPAADDVTEVDGDTYGPLKVACELRARDRYGDDLVVVRPTYVVGPHDYTWRFPWWVRRIAAGGEIPAPGPYDAPMQVIDGRDQATFMVGLLERRVPGAFHTVSPAPPFGFGDLLEAVAVEVAPPGTTFRWLDAEGLLASGLPEPALPLWHWGEPDGWAGAADPSAAIAEGLAVRPLARTVRETWEWVRGAGDPPAGVGLTPDQERALLRT